MDYSYIEVTICEKIKSALDELVLITKFGHI